MENIFAFILVLLTHIETGTHIILSISFCSFFTKSSILILYNSANQVISQKASSIEKGSIHIVFSFRYNINLSEIKV
ncbi:MAG: hypothetical protein Q8S84_03215 [bacterium]|nr:hypothetical protein [bacterium]MDP3380536.1 hypothetical protein [bacterium]